VSNPWKGTKAPPWQKPGARKGNGRLQKGILAAFKAKGADAALRTHDLVTACYPWDLV